MGLKGKLVSQTNIKSQVDVFELFKFPYHLADITPELVQSVDLLEGTWGTVGSIICSNYTQDGRKLVAKEKIEGLDEKKKSITFKAIEGALLDGYKALKTILDVDTNGEDNVITWTIEYEKESEGVSEPHEVMNFLIDFTKQIEHNSHHVLIPN